MRLTTSFACLVVSLLLATLASAAGPTSPETKAEMIRLIEALEKAPYDQATRDSIGTVMTWLVEAPDVSVTLCGELLGDLDELEKEGGDIFVTLLPFSEARFLLENPAKAADEQAVHVAGVEGMLRTYANMKAVKPELRIRHMEKLEKLQADKKLESFVKGAIEKCH